MSRSNFVQCQLAAPLTASATTATIKVGSAFTPPPVDGGLLVLTDSLSQPTAFEVVQYTTRGALNGGVYQIDGLTRGLEGTAARAWGIDAFIYQSMTVGDLQALLNSREPAIAGGTAGQFWSGDKTWRGLASDIRAALLTGLSTATNAAVTATDSVLAAFGKLQAQITGLAASKSDVGHTHNYLPTAGGTLTGATSVVGAASYLKTSWFDDNDAGYLYQGRGRGINVTKGVRMDANGTSIAYNSSGSAINLSNARIGFTTFSGATVGNAPTGIERMVIDEATVAITDNLTVSGREVVSYAIPGSAVGVTPDTSWTNNHLELNAPTGTGLPVVLALHRQGASHAALVHKIKDKLHINMTAGEFEVLHTGNGMPLAGGEFTGLVATKVAGHSVGATGGDGALSVRGDANSGAVMTFHRVGVYAINMGVDTDNVFRLGGWSNGAGTYRFAAAPNGDFFVSGALNATGGVIAGDWVYTSGDKGWFNSTYGGGIYMADSSYVRVYAGKGFFVEGEICIQNPAPIMKFNDTDWGPRYVHSNGGNIGFLRSDYGWGFYCSNDSNAWLGGTLTQASDIRLKTNIEVIPNALTKVEQLRGVTYNRTDIEMSRQTGVIAQEVQAVLPEVVSESADGHLAVAYGNMVGLLIEAVKELSAKVKELEVKVG